MNKGERVALVTGAATGIGLAIARRLARAGLVLLVMGVYASLDELTQPMCGRWAAWGDWNADLAGATLAVILAELAAGISRRRRASTGS